MRARSLLLLGVTWLPLLLASGCTDNTPVCVPGSVRAECSCNTGATGLEVCTADGLGYEGCLCGSGGDGGMPGDGGQ